MKTGISHGDSMDIRTLRREVGSGCITQELLDAMCEVGRERRLGLERAGILKHLGRGLYVLGTDGVDYDSTVVASQEMEYVP